MSDLRIFECYMSDLRIFECLISYGATLNQSSSAYIFQYLISHGTTFSQSSCAYIFQYLIVHKHFDLVNYICMITILIGLNNHTILLIVEVFLANHFKKLDQILNYTDWTKF
jgi:hypothetical protein